MDSVYTENNIGFVSLIDSMGTDLSICEAARVSTNRNSKKFTEVDNRAFIRTLLRKGHTSPFEMVELKFHIKLPIFVARQWIRHRTANVNELSGRYTTLVKENWVPSLERLNVKNTLDKDNLSKLFSIKINNLYSDCFAVYEELLAFGVSREVARTVLPLSTYTEWFWKIDLHNLLNFLKLRLHSSAQKEIREYAEIIKEIVKTKYPFTMEAFEYINDF